MTETTAECPDCGVGMQKANDGVPRCPYCNSWAFRDAVSDGAIYAAASKTTSVAQFGINTLASMPLQCGYCGMIHGPRCPSIQAIEYYQDGTVKRVEFVKPEPIKVDYSQVKIWPTGLVPDGRGGFTISVKDIPHAD